MKKGCLLAALVCICVTLFGCGAPVEPDYSDLIVPPLSGKVSDYLSIAEVEAVTGEPMTLQGLYEENSQAVYASAAEGNWQVTVNMQNNTRAGHDTFVRSLNACTSVEGVGEISHWCEETGSLLTFARGYTLEIYMDLGDDFIPQNETVALMKTLVGNLPLS